MKFIAGSQFVCQRYKTQQERQQNVSVSNKIYFCRSLRKTQIIAKNLYGFRCLF